MNASASFEGSSSSKPIVDANSPTTASAVSVGAVLSAAAGVVSAGAPPTAASMSSATVAAPFPLACPAGAVAGVAPVAAVDLAGIGRDSFINQPRGRSESCIARSHALASSPSLHAGWHRGLK